MDYISIIVYFLTVILLILGFVGTVLPMLPGVTLIFAGVILFSIYTGFSQISYLTILILFLLTLISLGIDYLSGAIGVKFSGASTWGTVGALLGALVGFSIFGFIGILIAPAIFVLIFELISNKSFKKSTKSASYTLLSTVLGISFNLVIATLMIVIFLTSILI